MADETNFADLPIQSPDQDAFDLAPFARSLAKSIRSMNAPQGVVIALNGEWGSGKSSAMNLICHYLEIEEGNEQIELVRFNPWWFRGEEALVLAFFRELYAATKPSIAAKAKKALPKLGARLFKGGSTVGAVADAAGAGGAGSIAASAFDWLGGLIEDSESVEKLHEELAAGLKAQTKRFVILIDDIDRLAPDEALAMFRLVKSVGRLPNIIYVLAYDRMLAERTVAQSFPSEGPHYLEKIVQAAFEIPPPEPMELRNRLQQKVFEICGNVPEIEVVETLNLFHEIVATEIDTPRDLLRYINALSVTWPAIAGEVYVGDFIAIEALRLFQPGIYQAIRAHPDMLCGSSRSGMSSTQGLDVLYDQTLLSSVNDKDRYRRGLMRLFPKTQSVWQNTIYSSEADWDRLRRVCAASHFPTYFRLSLGDKVLSAAETAEIIENAGDSPFIVRKLRDALKDNRRSGGTRASLILQSLQLHADEVAREHVEPLLTAIFSVADELNVESDQAAGFEIGNNSLRIHWLLRALLPYTIPLEERSAILIEAAKAAPIGWGCDLHHSAWRDYHPRDGEEAEHPEKCLLLESDVAALGKQVLQAIESAASDGSLLSHPELTVILYNWLDLANDKGKSVKTWTKGVIATDEGIARLAAALTSYSWSQGMGFGGLSDLVSRRSDDAVIQGIDALLDVKEFRRRLEELETRELLPELQEPIARYLQALRRQEKGDDD